MTINLKDDIPVQTTYTSVLKPLFKEVKEYVQDLLAGGWTVKSKLPFSAPVSMRLQERWDSQTIHPLQVSESADCTRQAPIASYPRPGPPLGGFSWLSILDQGKAFHQGFMAEGSRLLITFITPAGLYEWLRIPLGLSSALAAFHRSMEEMLDTLQD